MKTCRMVIGAALVLLVCSSGLVAWSADFDDGYIEEVSEGSIYVQGRLGLHVLEPVEECSWCREGTEVVVTFSKFARGTIKPADQSLENKPVRVLVLRDGREGT